MRYAGTDRDDQDPWFQIGRLEVSTTVAVVLLWAVSVLLWAAQPTGGVSDALMLSTDDVLGAQVWRLITWPFAQTGFGLFDIISVAIFYLFGTDLERQTGRKDMLLLLTGAVLAIGIFDVALGALLSEDAPLAGIGLVTLTVILLYIAEHPLRPFFFGIPAWVIGLVIVALEVINDIAAREWIKLLAIILASGVIARLARRIGLLSEYEWIPELQRREKKTGKPRRASRKARRKAAKSGLSEVPPEPTPAELRPTAPGALRRQPSRAAEVPSADDVALDLLLDKISAGGIDSLSAAERRELDEIQARRKRRK